ncbi:MAG: PilZ domain-containing protein [Treponema sp.]|nr:PilZ domain-containing protein [Treponema sp.]
MAQENRQNTRYKEIGKIFSQELCALPGILDDISASGCKIHYAYPIVVDLDSEYNLEITPARQLDNQPLRLRCKPQWVNEIDGNTFIGLETLYSPDANRLAAFIEHLEAAAQDPFSDITESDVN